MKFVQTCASIQATKAYPAGMAGVIHLLTEFLRPIHVLYHNPQTSRSHPKFILYSSHDNVLKAVPAHGGDVVQCRRGDGA